MYSNLVEFFELLHKTFPLSTMGEDFRGSHTLTYQKDRLELMVWENGRAFRIGLEEKDFADFNALIADVRTHVDTIEGFNNRKKFQKEC